MDPILVGGFNPFEKCSSNWIISPRIGMKIKKYWKPPPSIGLSFCFWAVYVQQIFNLVASAILGTISLTKLKCFSAIYEINP